MQPKSSNPDVMVLDHIHQGTVFRERFATIRAERYHLEGDHRPHDHQFLEVAFVVAGQALHCSLHGEHILERGYFVVLRPGVWHAYQACVGLEVLNAYVGQELLQRELAWIQQDPLLGRLVSSLPRSLDRQGVLIGRFEGAALAECQTYWEELERTSEKTDYLGRGELMGRLLLLLTSVAKGLEPLPENHRQAPTLSDAIRNCIEGFEADPAHPWTLKQLSQQAKLNPSHLSRLFTRATGLPPLAYLNRWRLEQAAMRLVQTEDAVAQIGAELGWTDANLFTRRFRIHFGRSPSAFRQQHR